MRKLVALAVGIVGILSIAGAAHADRFVDRQFQFRHQRAVNFLGYVDSSFVTKAGASTDTTNGIRLDDLWPLPEGSQIASSGDSTVKCFVRVTPTAGASVLASAASGSKDSVTCSVQGSSDGLSWYPIIGMQSIKIINYVTDGTASGYTLTNGFTYPLVYLRAASFSFLSGTATRASSIAQSAFIRCIIASTAGTWQAHVHAFQVGPN